MSSPLPFRHATLNVSDLRSAAISNLTLPTSTETVNAVRFNLAEASVLASIGSDRSFTLYDIRTGKAERRIIMQVRQEPRFPCSVPIETEL